MIFGSDRKKRHNSVVRLKKFMFEKNNGLPHEGGGRREVEVGVLLLGNDKNNLTADKVLSYF